MLEEKIRYVRVWSGLLRAAHWLLAAGVVFLLASGWLAQNLAAGNAAWRDWHVIAGQAVVLVLVLRIGLLFRRGSEGWRAFVPSASSLRGARQTLVFYATLGRSPLPAWYAHNPLWQLLYPLMGLLVVVAATSGLAHQAPYLVAGVSPAVLHGGAAGALGLLAAVHVVTVVLHDLRGRGAFVSAMINGHRYFHVSVQPDGLEPPGRGQTVDVSFDTHRPGARPPRP